MKKTFQIFLLLLFSLLFSCKKESNNNYRLTDEDKTWNIYHEGDTIKFLSNQMRHRIYSVEGVNQQIIEYTGVEVNNNESYNYEVISIRFQRIDTLIADAKFNISIMRGYPGDPKKGFILMIYWICDLDFNYFSFSEPPTIDTLSVNNVLYENVYSYGNINYTVYYQKQKGWLRIQSKSGEIWNRIN